MLLRGLSPACDWDVLFVTRSGPLGRVLWSRTVHPSHTLDIGINSHSPILIQLAQLAFGYFYYVGEEHGACHGADAAGIR